MTNKKAETTKAQDRQILMLLASSPHTCKELGEKLSRSPNAINLRIKKLMEENPRIVKHSTLKTKTRYGHSVATVFSASLKPDESLDLNITVVKAAPRSVWKITRDYLQIAFWGKPK
jgi:DNA-binding Lrp family transcriptional regulator